MAECDEDCKRPMCPRHEIDRRRPATHRTSATLSRNAHMTGKRLHQHVKSRPVAERPGLSESGHTAVDDTWIYRTRVPIADAQSIRDTRRVAFDDHIGLC